MYRYNKELSKLPIPDLNKTMNEYLEWIKPLVTAEEFMTTQDKVAEFLSPQGMGSKLQNKLIESEFMDNKSWLKPMWDDMYLSYREPLVLNMNYYSVIDNEKFKESLTPSQLAALVIVKAVTIYFSIIDNALAPEMNKKIPLCMDQYKNTFKAVRIPRKKQDDYRIGARTKENNHIMFFYNNQMYKILVTDEQGDVLSLDAIALTIDEIVNRNMADQDINISALTTSDRDHAADIYQQLLSDENNKTNIEMINEAVIVICLDEKMDSQEKLCRNMLLSNGKNRYFDKSSQIIITKDCEIGFNNEHTGADGTTWFTIMENMYDFIMTNKDAFDNMVTEKASYHHLEWQLDKSLNKELNKVLTTHQAVSDSIDIKYLNFDDFGKDYIKTLGVSPDAFFHIALQLAQYRTFNCLKSTYEPVAMRSYREGRTDCTRPINDKVKILVEQFDDCIDADVLKKLIHEAVKAHVDRIKICQSGSGVERHLYGLNKMYDLHFKNDEGVDIFKDGAYQKLKYDFISTSGLGSENIRCFGFGPVVKDGFGIGYGIKKKNISCTVSCRVEHKEKSELLINNLWEAFRDISRTLNGNNT